MSLTRPGCFSAILRQSCRNSSNPILAVSSYNSTLDEKINLPCAKQHNSKLNIALHMLKFWHKNVQLIFKNKWVNYSKTDFGLLLLNLINFYFKVKYLLVEHMSVCWLLLMLLCLDLVLGHGLLLICLFLVLWFLSHLWLLLSHPFFFLSLSLFPLTPPILHSPHHYSRLCLYLYFPFASEKQW